MFIYLQTKRKIDMISNKQIKLCSPSGCKINIFATFKSHEEN